MPLAAVAAFGQRRCLTELGRSLHTSAVLHAKAAFKRKTPDHTRQHEPRFEQRDDMDSNASAKSRHRSSGPPKRVAPKAKQKQLQPVIPTVQGPVLDENTLLEKHEVDPARLPKGARGNSKGMLLDWAKHADVKLPSYDGVKVIIDGKTMYRCVRAQRSRACSRRNRATLRLENLLAEGDALTKREAERLCSFAAVLQLESQLQLEFAKADPAKDTVSTVSFPDGSVVDYEIAKQFMEYYCRRFNFDTPDLQYQVKKLKRPGNPPWDAIMHVDGRRIAMGTGANKRIAMCNAYLDVTQFLHASDPDLWTAFKEAARTGKDLGLAPKVSLVLADALTDNIRSFNRFLRGSELYNNRPTATSANTQSDAGAAFRRDAVRPSLAFHESKSARLQEERLAYKQNPALEQLRNQRESLPVYTQAAELLSMVEENEVTICMAATGSGKTTQIPQIILDDWIANGRGSRCNILCTQPRRLAAISVAERVAKERGELCGKSIGYQVRFDTKMPEMHGCVTFCTTGIFLRRMQTALQDLGESRGHNLDDVTHVIVDEAHERDVDTDLTLMVLKRLLADRRARKIPIKVILMSATIDPTLFQQYFPTETGQPAPLIQIPGRSFPVKKHFLDDFFPDIKQKFGLLPWVFREDSVVKYLNRELGMGQWGIPPPLMRAASSYTSVASVQNSPRLAGVDPEVQRSDDDLDIPYPLVALTIAHVLGKSDDGHVLVFMPGWEEIMSVQRILEDPTKPKLGINFLDRSKYQLLILHSSVPVADQQKVFEPPPPGIRRIILSTNVAETSVTIPDVVYVVDAARVKELRFEPERHMSSLVSAWVGSSNLNQRAGRAGRHRPGEYFGVLSNKRAASLHPYQTVEMLRTDLSNVVMHIKALNFPGMEVEDVLASTIEPPDPDRVEAAMSHLKMVGALDKDKNLTSLGRVLLQLPIEAPVGRLLLLGCFFRCLDRALTLAAIVTNRDPFLAPVLQKREAQARKDSWASYNFRSDPLAVLRAFESWWALQGTGQYNTANQFCFDNFLSKPTLLMIQKIKGHLLQSLYTSGVIDVAMGRNEGAAPMPPGMRRSDQTAPAQLSENKDSLPLLAALIAVASQPKFAVRTSSRTFRTEREKVRARK